MLELRLKQAYDALKERDWTSFKNYSALAGYDIRHKLDDARNMVFTPLLSPGARERVQKGVAPYMFWDYHSKVMLMAESLREAAKKRQGNMIRWESRKEELGWNEETFSLDFDKETELLNKWADILSIADSDLMDEPYYKPYWDYIGSGKSEPARWDEKGKPVAYRCVFPEQTEESKKIGQDVDEHEHAIHMLQIDILVELAENHRYMWD